MGVAKRTTAGTARRGTGRLWASVSAVAVAVVAIACSQPATALGAGSAAAPGQSLATADAGVQTAQARLAFAERDVRSATQRAQQLAYAVVALHNQLIDAQLAVEEARSEARTAVRAAFDDATVDPTATLLADLDGANPGLGSEVRNRQLGDAGARVVKLQKATERLTMISRGAASGQSAALNAAARAIGDADQIRSQLAAAEQTRNEIRTKLEIAAERAALDDLNSQLAQSLLALGETSGVPGIGERLVANTPTELRALYQKATLTCPGLPWGVLAGIGQVETDNGRVTAVSSAGAMGPMQFMPSTWAIYGIDGNGDGRADILNQVDAVYSAARYLCVSGGGNPATLYKAIFAYNHSDFYVNTVLGLAAQLR